MKMKINFSLEDLFPFLNGRWAGVENIIIPFLPYCPSSDHE